MKKLLLLILASLLLAASPMSPLSPPGSPIIWKASCPSGAYNMGSAACLASSDLSSPGPIGSAAPDVATFTSVTIPSREGGQLQYMGANGAISDSTINFSPGATQAWMSFVFNSQPANNDAICMNTGHWSGAGVGGTCPGGNGTLFKTSASGDQTQIGASLAETAANLVAVIQNNISNAHPNEVKCQALGAVVTCITGTDLAGTAGNAKAVSSSNTTAVSLVNVSGGNFSGGVGGSVSVTAFQGNVSVAPGSAGSPSLCIGTSCSIYQQGDGVGFSSGGAEVFECASNQCQVKKLLSVATNGTTYMIYSNSDPVWGVTNDGITQTTAVQFKTGAASKPTCNSGNRGTVWYTPGASSAADKIEICAKNSSDAYGYIAMATIP